MSQGIQKMLEVCKTKLSGILNKIDLTGSNDENVTKTKNDNQVENIPPACGRQQ